MRGGWSHPLSSNGKSCGNLLTHFATRRLAVEQYQSIDDTIVQLFSSSASVLITTSPSLCGGQDYAGVVLAGRVATDTPDK